jgi:putative transposase
MMWKAHNSSFLFNDPEEKLHYLTNVQEDYLKKCDDRPFEIHFFVVMGNHIHVSGILGENPEKYSDHLRRAHSRFGLAYNRRHGRSGAVGNGRPKIKTSQDDHYTLQTVLYEAYNPVRAGLIKSPTDIRWKNFSCARYLAFGEPNKFSSMITKASWYIALGKTPRQRERKFRQRLDEYGEQEGLKRSSVIRHHMFVGSPVWVAGMEERIRRYRAERNATGPPPDSS